jgi:hypothetical protein
MKKLSQIEVEPLSEQRWAKIGRSLATRLAVETNDVNERSFVPRSRFGGRAWLLAAALMGAAVGAVVAARSLSDPAVVEHPSRITTGSTPSHLALSGLSLDVEPQSAVVVGAETPQGLLIIVDRGSIVCQVAPRSKDAPVIVQAGAARVRVLGTRFSVARLGESARVKVQQGVVEVSSRGGTYRVQAGEEWSNVGTPPVPAEPVGVSSAASSASNDEAGPRGPSTARRASTATKAKSASALAPTPESAVALGPSRQEIFEQATLLERSDPGRASKLYGSLESGGDSWAQHALYARGRLEATRGNGTEARRLLERYLERFPNGSNAEDAQAVLKRLR